MVRTSPACGVTPHVAERLEHRGGAGVDPDDRDAAAVRRPRRDHPSQPALAVRAEQVPVEVVVRGQVVARAVEEPDGGVGRLHRQRLSVGEVGVDGRAGERHTPAPRRVRERDGSGVGPGMAGDGEGRTEAEAGAGGVERPRHDGDPGHVQPFRQAAVDVLHRVVLVRDQLLHRVEVAACPRGEEGPPVPAALWPAAAAGEPEAATTEVRSAWLGRAPAEHARGRPRGGREEHRGGSRDHGDRRPVPHPAPRLSADHVGVPAPAAVDRHRLPAGSGGAAGHPRGQPEPAEVGGEGCAAPACGRANAASTFAVIRCDGARRGPAIRDRRALAGERAGPAHRAGREDARAGAVGPVDAGVRGLGPRPAGVPVVGDDLERPRGVTARVGTVGLREDEGAEVLAGTRVSPA